MSASIVVGSVGAVVMAFADVLGMATGLREPEFPGAVVGPSLVALTLVVLAVAFWLRGSGTLLLVVAVIHLVWGLVVCINRLMIGELPPADAILLVLGGAIVVFARGVERAGIWHRGA